MGLRILSGLVLSLCVFASGVRAVEFPAHRGGGVAFGGGTFADTTFEQVSYVSSEFLASLFGTPARWDPLAQQQTITGPGRKDWVFTLDNPFMTVQGEVYNLTYPVRRGPERIYLPLHPVLRVLRAQGIAITPGSAPRGAVAHIPRLPVPGAADAAPESDTSITAPHPPGAARITGMVLEENTEGVILRIRAERGAEWQGVLSRPHYILRAFGGRLDPEVPARLQGSGPLMHVEARQDGEVTQFTLRLRGARDSVELLPEANGWRVVVRRHVERPDEARARGTIIVDAGHGGKDPGAVVRGVRESDVNLAVALRLRTELQNMGYKVLLTRDKDVFLTLQERPQFASDNNGDVFVSLHSNSIAGPPSRQAQVSGFVAYILREAQSEEDKAIARRENQAIEQAGGGGKTEISPLDWILLEHQLNLYSKQSEALTESIVKNFSGFEIPKYSTGARQAGFFVLVGAYMPAVLFEMGFLTNDRDRRVLSSPQGQREIARRLARAIDDFQRSRNGGG